MSSSASAVAYHIVNQKACTAVVRDPQYPAKGVQSATDQHIHAKLCVQSMRRLKVDEAAQEGTLHDASSAMQLGAAVTRVNACAKWETIITCC